MIVDRRDALKLAGLGLAASAVEPSLAQLGGSSATPRDHILWYRQPARMWLEALPIGNGKVGAMVFGAPRDETLHLNLDTLWAGQPYNPVNPQAKSALPEVRRLIFEGRYAEAEALANEKVMARPLTQMPFQSAGVLSASLVPAFDNDAVDYRRELDLDRAVATVSYGAQGARFTRESFVSAVDDVLVMRVVCDKPGLLGGRLAWQPGQEGSFVPAAADELLFRGKNRAQAGIAAGLAFAMHAKVLADKGEVARRGDALDVKGADEIIVLVALASNYRRFDLVGGDPVARTAAALAAASRRSYAELLERHLADHRRLYRAVSLDFGGTPQARRATDARIAVAEPEADPALAALYFNYARYLLISSSRPGGQPANLQGIWNNSNEPPWGSKYTININTEMNYWLAEPAGLAECTLPLIAMVEELARSGARTAREMYGARGWVAHHNTDLWRATAPIDGAQWGLWPLGGAWLSLHLWDHYDYGADAKFLARIWPVMRDAAIFFLDTLMPYPGTNFLVTNPSLSPENVHGRGSSLAAGPTMDMQILRDLFDRCCEAGKILGRDRDICARFADARARLVPNRLGKAGQLMEWMEDWDMTAQDLHHRHVSHLYGLHPSFQINPDETPELAKAAHRTLELRGDEATGWGLAWRMNFWARLRDGDHAYRLLSRLLQPDRTYPNMFDAHPPFQIDGNFGGAAGMLEMLVQNRDELVHLLPALPGAWPNGSLRGVRLRRGAELDLSWQNGTLAECELRARRSGEWHIRYGPNQRKLSLRAGRSVRLTGANLQG